MGIGSFMREAVLESVFLGALKKAWNLGTKLYHGLNLGEKVKDYLVKEKGWEDENLFALALSQASLEPNQQKSIEKGVLLAEELDKKNGTRYARNFRIMVVVNDKNPAHVCNKPSLNILEYIGNTCNDETEVLLAIAVMGAMHDEQILSFEKFMHIAKTYIWPFLEKNGRVIAKAASVKLEEVTEKLEKGNEEWKKSPLWKKLFFNSPKISYKEKKGGKRYVKFLRRALGFWKKRV